MNDLEEDYTMPCPHCGESIHEEAQICPACDQYVDDATPKKSWVFFVAVLLLILITLSLINQLVEMLNAQ